MDPLPSDSFWRRTFLNYHRSYDIQATQACSTNMLLPEKLNYVTIHQCPPPPQSSAGHQSPRSSTSGLLPLPCPDCCALDDEVASSSESNLASSSRCPWHQRHHNLRRNMLRLVVLILAVSFVSVVLVAGLSVLGSGYFVPLESPIATNFTNVEDQVPSEVPPPRPRFALPAAPNKLSKAQKAEISRKTWELLNRNADEVDQQVEEPENHVDRIPVPENVFPPPSRPSMILPRSKGGVVVPSVMVYTPSAASSTQQGQMVKDYLAYKKSTTGVSKKNCCQSQKYLQTLHMDGCQPLTVTNRMCQGQCVSVWVPGVFSSFPACRPSRTQWKYVTFTCGKNGEKRKRVKVEKVRRCSCMESDA